MAYVGQKVGLDGQARLFFRIYRIGDRGGRREARAVGSGGKE